MGREKNLILDSDRLLTLASTLALETTEKKDLLICMRAMVSAVRNYSKTDE
jgi:hypothetical protein